MSKYLIGAYGVANYLFQHRRQISSQSLINKNNNISINPKDIVIVTEPTYLNTENNNFEIGIMSNGSYQFLGIGLTNMKCLIKTDENEILLFSKGESLKTYNIRLIAPNHKKIKFVSEKGLTMVICYWNFSINSITNVITDYFKNDKIIKIINYTDNLDENWNDILSINIENSITNNNFDNPTIEIVDKKNKSKLRDISEISNKYNFEIINKYYNKNKNNLIKDIIDDPKLISIISQDHKEINLDNDDIFIWIMDYLEDFTISNGKFFKYFELIENKNDFVKFLVAHKIASLYVMVKPEEEIKLINKLNIILNSDNFEENLSSNDIAINTLESQFGTHKVPINFYQHQLINESIKEYGLVSQSNISPEIIKKIDSTNYYNSYQYYSYYYFNDYSSNNL